jgi:hypothetical protein
MVISLANRNYATIPGVRIPANWLSTDTGLSAGDFVTLNHNNTAFTATSENNNLIGIVTSFTT